MRLTVVLLTALAAAVAGAITRAGQLADPAGLTAWYTLCWALFAAAAWSLRRVPARRTAVLVIAGGLAVGATGLLDGPRTSTDSYRYAWDGRVQAAGVSPYNHPPADPALAGLRDEWLFPDRSACSQTYLSWLPEGGCTRINRPTVPTIYPPVAEAYFLAVHTLSPDGSRHKPLQFGGLLLAMATTLLLLRTAGPRAACLWAWCPAVPVEAVNNAHADVLAVLLAVAGIVVVARRRVAGGALLGAAVAAKFLPALLLPGVLSRVRRPRDALAVLVPAGAVVAAAYLPYLLASKASVFGYLVGYTAEEGYQDASDGRYFLVRWLLPDAWAPPVVVGAMVCVAAYTMIKGDPERPWTGALTVTGTAFLLLTPGYSWYALLVVALVALDGRWEWLGVAAAGAAAYVTDLGTAAYAAAALLVAVVTWCRVLARGVDHRRAETADAGGRESHT
ncbi:glycosyltransferase 87 family protein [Herbidospora cretacea]|uniref:glycosyltransferase 87 family protein n=1 Tax=Herbidospora cretacea TaxID=28444 RepID=UPI00068FBDB9|nr:glycosyltransferase 87 family protein [Herbidospora cretacea]